MYDTMNQQHPYSNTAINLVCLVVIIECHSLRSHFHRYYSVIETITTHVKIVRKMKVKSVFLVFLHFLSVLGGS